MKKNQKKKWIFALFFIAYLILLFYFLFFAEILGRTKFGTDYHYNLIPFREIQRFWMYRDVVGIAPMMLNIVGNVVAFMPFGILVPILSYRCRNVFHTVLLSFELSLSVEVIQLISKTGSFDVDDLILNTLGGLAGYLCFKIIQAVRKCYYGKKKL
ncbi:MAG: VanZ family protein [Lachnospiraceae bacterium]